MVKPLRINKNGFTLIKTALAFLPMLPVSGMVQAQHNSLNLALYQLKKS